jgi:hypothetical protein
MTTGLTYSDYVTQIAQMAVVPSTDPNFQAILPAMITYAENRIYRDLDLLTTVSSNSSYALSNNSRSLSFALGDFITVQEVNVITPAGVTNPDLGTRNALLPVTKEFLNYVYSSAASKAVPYYFAMLNQNTLVFGPWSDNNYTVEIVGTIRPNSLSGTNTTTFISLYLPDLMIMASLVYIAAFQRNFSSSMSNDPQMPVTYEQQYQTLLKSAGIEEFRKKFQAGGWTSMTPAVAASPTRG